MTRTSPDARWTRWLTSCCALLMAAGLLAVACFSDEPFVTAIELKVSDVERSRQFFERVLEFSSEPAIGEPAAIALRLGRESLVLRGGGGSRRTRTANDPAFQHVAIVVADIDRAFARLVDAGVEIVSAGPQRLPDRNRDAAGIRAVYFRDPDGHFLELIQFPPFKGEPRWQRRDGGLFLGIDHTAVVVADGDRSTTFFRDELGMTRVGDSFNFGTEQDALSGVAGARVRITSFRGASGPGVELLEYVTPRPPASSSANDWTIHVASRGDRAARTDPDGHAIASERGRPIGAIGLAAQTFSDHWTRYAMEAAELGAFMVATVWFTLLLEHPRSALNRRLPSATLRRAIMGVAIGATVIVILRSPFGTASGAHFNPAVTIALCGVGRIAPWDAAFYAIAQFVGGAAGVALAALPFWSASRHEKVSFAATLPGPRGVAVAILAEVVISFALISTLLLVQRDADLKPYAAFFAGGLLFFYILFEAPLSGMSMNPARTVASAIFARRLGTAWLYFVAPVPAMWIAARLFGR